MNHLTRRQAIRLKCLDCAGSPKEVTLCHIFDCPLWHFRCGYSAQSPQYRERIEKAQVRFTKEFKDLVDMGINTSFFDGNPPKTVHSEKNSEQAISEY